MDRGNAHDIKLIRGAQAAQLRTRVAELSEQVKKIQDRMDDLERKHSLGLDESELASIITKQVREALPPFVDDILDGEMSHKIAAVNEFSLRLGEIIACAIALPGKSSEE